MLAFVYGDPIVLALLDVYRRYYGWRMALYIFGVVFAGALAMDGAFSALHLVTPNPNTRRSRGVPLVARRPRSCNG